MPRIRSLAGAVCLVAAVSCRDSTGPSNPGITVIAGGEATDTVSAILAQALVVEVRDPDRRRVPAGTIVRFQGAGPSFFSPEVLVGAIAGQDFTGFSAVETDADGRAAVLIRLGIRAGPARLVISVPILGLVDTVTYTVTPGAASRIVISPADTLITIGQSYTLTAVVVDRFQNERSDPVDWTSAQSGVSVTSGGSVTTNAVGRYTLTATAGELSATAALSVPPDFRLVAYEMTGELRIITANVNGTQRAVIATISDGGIGAHPVWMPGTGELMYSTVEGGQQRLRVAAPEGPSRLFIPTPPAEMSHEAEPAPSADGNWVFYSGFNTACGGANDYCVHRATSAGESPTLLAAGNPSRQPAPSPDGSMVAFVRGAFSSEIRVLDVAAGTVSAWTVTGTRPSWSPQGGKFAFVNNGRIAMVNGDGSGFTVIQTGTNGWGGPIQWSPDGAWLVGRYEGRLALLEVATGTLIPLPWTGALVSADIR